MEACGTCRRTDLLRKKGKRDQKKSGDRLLLVEHLTDIKHAIDSTDGCYTYLREVEGLDSINQMPGGAKTRWKFWIQVAAWLKPTSTRSLPAPLSPGTSRDPPPGPCHVTICMPHVT